MREVLGDPSTESIIVLHGQPGSGKSELAREFARRHHHRYPGGTYFIDGRAEAIIVNLAQIGLNSLGLDFHHGLRLEDQAARTLHVLAEAPSLLIFDGVASEDAIRAWLPPSGVSCHAVITSVVDCWDPGWLVVPVPPLSRVAALDLIEHLAGPEAAARYGEELATLAGGLPVQIVPMATFMRRAALRGRIDSIKLTLTKEADESFRGVYEQLESTARLLLHTAARMNHQHIIPADIAAQLVEACGWSDAEFDGRLDACRDLGWLEGAAEIRMHQLYGNFLLGTVPSSDVAAGLAQVVRVQARRVIDIAAEVAVAPNRADRAAALITYPVRRQFWTDSDISVVAGETLGRALSEIGQFAAARPWFERAVAGKEKGGVHGGVDHEDLGKSLHEVGICLLEIGEFAAARPWFERAVATKERGDVQGRVDYESLGQSLYYAGECLREIGELATARAWYERAVAAKEKGDLHGRVNHESLGTSLHQVGICLSNTGEFAGACPWYERAVAEGEKGDVHGRVDHESLGKSLHQVGICLASTGKCAAARLWYERAVAESEKGDVYGRVNHEGLGTSLHGVAQCLASTGKLAAARLWYERAVAAKEKGDVHGRVDHESLALTLRAGARCLLTLGFVRQSKAWAERASGLPR